MPKDAGDSTTDALRSDIKSANGGMLTVESPWPPSWKSGEAPPGGLACRPDLVHHRPIP